MWGKNLNWQSPVAFVLTNFYAYPIIYLSSFNTQPEYSNKWIFVSSLCSCLFYGMIILTNDERVGNRHTSIPYRTLIWALKLFDGSVTAAHTHNMYSQYSVLSGVGAKRFLTHEWEFILQEIIYGHPITREPLVMLAIVKPMENCCWNINQMMKMKIYVKFDGKMGKKSFWKFRYLTLYSVVVNANRIVNCFVCARCV